MASWTWGNLFWLIVGGATIIFVLSQTAGLILAILVATAPISIIIILVTALLCLRT